MDGFHILLIALLGVTSGHQVWISRSVMAGDNITLYCDSKTSAGSFNVWFRNCSHQNQPTLVLDLYPIKGLVFDVNNTNVPPHFKIMRNDSSESYDLEISNITASDEGLYYCGTREMKVEDKEHISMKKVYKYGNVTKVRVGSSDPHPAPNCDICCTLLFSLCPVVAVVSSLLSSLLVYRVCGNKVVGVQNEQNILDIGSQTRINQEEGEVNYAALNFRKHRDQGRQPTSTDFCTYSAVKASRK